MASQVSIAIERDAAIDRINAALALLSQQGGRPYDGIPVQGRDQQIVNKNQLVYIADTLDALVTPAPDGTVTLAPVDVPADATPDDADRDTEDADTEPVDVPPVSLIEAQVAALRPKSGKAK